MPTVRFAGMRPHVQLVTPFVRAPAVRQRRRVGRRFVACLIVAVLAIALAQPGSDAPPIAGEGFDRPEQLADLQGVFGADVAVAPVAGTGPLLLWQDQDGLVARAATGGEVDRVVSSLGVRGVWAGAADGDAVIVWLDRDLSTGTSTLTIRWRGETRTILETRQTILASVVREANVPEVVMALPGSEGWRLSLWSWDRDVRSTSPRTESVSGLDAVRSGDGVRIAWLEGSNERVLGRIEADWRAYLARWPDGATTPDRVVELGAAARRDVRDVARIGGADDDEVAFAAPDGSLIVAREDGARRSIGTGRPIGWLDGRWTWYVEDQVRRTSADGGVTTVLRMPSEPQRMAAGTVNGVVGLIWSSGRYSGGLEVWGVHNASSYRSGPLERFAVSMGWDPWRIWTAAGGHLLLALLVALIGSMALAPIWWLGASLLARRRTTSLRAIAAEGAALGIASIVVVAIPVATRVARLGGPGAAFLIDPGWLVGGAISGFALAVVWLGRRDLEATFGRLISAFVAGAVLLTILAFGTLSVWQRLIAQVA